MVQIVKWLIFKQSHFSAHCYVELTLHKHSGLDEQVIRAYVKTQEDLDRQEDLFNQ